jgi:hypothetical protein
MYDDKFEAAVGAAASVGDVHDDHIIIDSPAEKIKSDFADYIHKRLSGKLSLRRRKIWSGVALALEGDPTYGDWIRDPAEIIKLMGEPQFGSKLERAIFDLWCSYLSEVRPLWLRTSGGQSDTACHANSPPNGAGSSTVYEPNYCDSSSHANSPYWRAGPSPKVKPIYRNRPRVEKRGDQYFVGDRPLAGFWNPSFRGGHYFVLTEHIPLAFKLVWRHEFSVGILHRVPCWTPVGFADIQYCQRCGCHFLGHQSAIYCGECKQLCDAENKAHTAARPRHRKSTHDRDKEVICCHCGKPTDHQRSTRKFCGDACRKAAHREGGKVS